MERAKLRPSVSLEHSIHSAGYSEYSVSMAEQGTKTLLGASYASWESWHPSVHRSGTLSVGVVDRHASGILDVTEVCLCLGCDPGLGYYS